MHAQEVQDIRVINSGRVRKVVNSVDGIGRAHSIDWIGPGCQCDIGD